eukprot:3591063-Amphidinium_carterae.1
MDLQVEDYIDSSSHNKQASLSVGIYILTACCTTISRLKREQAWHRVIVNMIGNSHAQRTRL